MRRILLPLLLLCFLPPGARGQKFDGLAAGRPVVLSICEWGTDKPWERGKSVGHLWRTTGDIYNCFAHAVRSRTLLNKE